VRSAKVVKTEVRESELAGVSDEHRRYRIRARKLRQGSRRREGPCPSGNRTTDRSTSTLSVIPATIRSAFSHSRRSNATRPPPYRLHSPRHKRGSPFSSLLGKICSSAKQFATYKARGRRRGGRYTKANVRLILVDPKRWSGKSMNGASGNRGRGPKAGQSGPMLCAGRRGCGCQVRPQAQAVGLPALGGH
jgi:hypothetical protein